MNIKKAIVSAVILYAILFLFDLMIRWVLMIVDERFGIIMVVISAITTFLIAKEYYFRGSQLVKPVKEGLMLGLVMLAISFIINLPLWIYNGFISFGQIGWLIDTTIRMSTSLEAMVFWSIRHGELLIIDWTWILSYILTLLVPALVAYIKK
jgi:hypothetical protein